MTWFRGRCPYLIRGRCQIAGAICGDVAPVVSESDCDQCSQLPEPTRRNPNATVERLVRAWKRERSQVRAREPVAVSGPTGTVGSLPRPAYTEADFPCIHRGPQSLDADGPMVHQCTPCDGGKLHVLYDCTLKGRECTITAAPKARGKDGGVTLCCLACDDRQAGPVPAVPAVSSAQQAAGQL